MSHPILLVSLAAATAPVLSSHTRSLRIPGVVFEILLGVVIGPQCLGLVEFDRNLPFLSELGMCFLFFLAGAEIDLGAMRGAPLKLATLSWLASLLLAGVVAFGLSLVGGSQAWTLVAVALATTALGIIVPVLRDGQLLGTELAKYTLAAGTLGEIGPILLMSLLLSKSFGVGVQLGLVALFALIVLAVCVASLRVRPSWLIAILSRTMTQSGQLPIRISLLLLTGLIVLADEFGLDLALGAFAAGMAVGLAVRGSEQHVLHHKFDALGFGFLVPIFFVTSGVKLDVRALFGTPANVGMLLAYALLLLAVRGVPALLFRRVLPPSQRRALGFFSATSLSLIVALTGTAVDRHLMAADAAAALVGGGLISVLVFPVIATRLAGRSAELDAAPVANEVAS